MSEPIILSLGSVNVVFQVRIERRPDPGETLLGRDFAQLSGGKGAYVAHLAVTAYGSQPAYPSPEELGASLAQLAAGARVIEQR